jgi:hypothetical protein
MLKSMTVTEAIAPLAKVQRNLKKVLSDRNAENVEISKTISSLELTKNKNNIQMDKAERILDNLIKLLGD